MGLTATGISGGQRLGKYVLVSDLGAGGMARVSLAAAHGPGGANKLLVIKQIQERYAEDPEFLTMFLDEARLAARLRHPNVVQTYEVGEEDGRYFIAMEYLEGQTLGRVRARLGRRGLSLRVHLQVLIDALAGLHYAHELADYDRRPLQVVHRDATPENVFITYDGMVKVVDFGIAKARDQSNDTVAGTIKGKVTYMPPEQARGEALDRRADVFAVGVMLWEAATGVRMWKGMEHTAVLQRLFAHSIPLACQVNPAVPERLDAIICKAVAPDRQDRHATAAELQAELEAYLAELGGRLPERELGRLVATHFEVERSRIRARIQEHVHDADEPPPSLSPVPHDRGTRPEVRLSDVSTPPSSREAFARSFPSRPPPAPRARRGGLALGIAGAALALVCAAAVVARETTTKPVVTAAGTAAPEVSAAAIAPVAVTLRVWALPREAQIFLDDRLLAQNPFRGELPADAAAHRLRIEAAGYRSFSEPLSLGKSRDLDVILASLPAEPLADARASAGPVKTAPGSKGRRRLDDANPYTARQ